MKLYSKFDYNYFEHSKIRKDRRFVFRFYTSLIRRYKKSGNLLEIGCSFGYLLKRLEKDFNTYGIDKSSYAIKSSKNICRKSKTYVGDARNLSIFKNRFFDVVIALHVLEHLNTPEKAIAEVHRILKNNGIFIFVTPNTTSLMRKIKRDDWFGYRDKTHISLLNPNEWLSLLENKFEIIKIFSDGFWDSPYIPIIPTMAQKPVFGFMTAVQFIFCLPFIHVRLGENIVVIARKS